MMCIFTHACYVCMSTHKRTKLSDLCSRSENRYLYFSKETWREESLLNRENFAFSAAAEIQKGGYHKVLNAESRALVLTALPQQCDISTAHIGIHEWAHTKSTVKRRRHKSANTLMQTDIHTQTPALPNKHTVRYLCTLSSAQSVHPSVYPSLITTPVSSHCLFLLPIHPAYHIADVSLPINAHRAALQWSWRVPQQQSTVQSLQTCMYVPAEQNAAGEEGRSGTESKGKWAENMSSQADRTAVCHRETCSRTNTHVGVYVQRDFTQMRVNSQTKIPAFTYTHTLNMDFAHP